VSNNGNGLGVAGYGDVSPFDRAPQPPIEAEDQGMSLRDYLGVIWRRKWIILLIVAIAAGSAYYFSARKPKQYAATATMIYEPEYQTSATVGTYSYDVYGRDVVLNSVNDLMQSPNLMQRMVATLKKEGYPGVPAVSAVPQGGGNDGSLSTASVVAVTATGTNPKAIAAAANAATAAFVDWRTERARQQIDNNVLAIKSRMGDFKKSAHKTADYLLLQQRLADYQLLAKTANGGFRVLVPAGIPTVPFAPTPWKSAFVGFGIGVVAALCIAFLMEMLDTRIRRPDEVATSLRAPILGRIPKISGHDIGEGGLVVMQHPEGHIAEAFRMVRTNLEFASVDSQIKSILVTSALKGEGKSVAVANLAISMALAGKKVVIVDADMRRPRQHKLFKVNNETGLSTVATGQTALMKALVAVDVTPKHDDQKATEVATAGTDFAAWARGAESLSRLYVLPSGPIPPNPGEIVSSKRFQAIIDALESEADLVIVDTPALLAVGDTSAIAAKVDGLLYLVDFDKSKKPQLFTAAEQILRLPTRVLGCVLRVHHARSSRYYYYSPYYYYRYSYTEDGQRQRQRHPRRRSTDRETA